MVMMYRCEASAVVIILLTVFGFKSIGFHYSDCYVCAVCMLALENLIIVIALIMTYGPVSVIDLLMICA